jgi:hypothetical protein
MRPRSLAFLASLTVLVGCYHATIDTGAKPSTTVIENHWASGWIFGLVPPKTVETAAKCPNGVAKVETQLSFVNQLVSLLTLSIYTPMDIRVTCAEGPAASMSLIIPATAPTATWQLVMTEAAIQAAASDAAVYVQVTN